MAYRAVRVPTKEQARALVGRVMNNAEYLADGAKTLRQSRARLAFALMSLAAEELGKALMLVFYANDLVNEEKFASGYRRMLGDHDTKARTASGCLALARAVYSKVGTTASRTRTGGGYYAAIQKATAIIESGHAAAMVREGMKQAASRRWGELRQQAFYADAEGVSRSKEEWLRLLDDVGRDVIAAKAVLALLQNRRVRRTFLDRHRSEMQGLVLVAVSADDDADGVAMWAPDDAGDDLPMRKEVTVEGVAAGEGERP